MAAWTKQSARDGRGDEQRLVRGPRRPNLVARIVLTLALPLIAYIAVRWLLPPLVNDLFAALGGGDEGDTEIQPATFTLPAVLAASATAIAVVPRLWGHRHPRLPG